MVWPFKKKEEKSEEKEEPSYSDVPTEPYEPSYAKDEKRPSYSSISYSPDAMPHKPSYDDVPTERYTPSYDEDEEEPRPKRNRAKEWGQREVLKNRGDFRGSKDVKEIIKEKARKTLRTDVVVDKVRRKFEPDYRAEREAEEAEDNIGSVNYFSKKEKKKQEEEVRSGRQKTLSSYKIGEERGQYTDEEEDEANASFLRGEWTTKPSTVIMWKAGEEKDVVRVTPTGRIVHEKILPKQTVNPNAAFMGDATSYGETSKDRAEREARLNELSIAKSKYELEKIGYATKTMREKEKQELRGHPYLKAGLHAGKKFTDSMGRSFDATGVTIRGEAYKYRNRGRRRSQRTRQDEYVSRAGLRYGGGRTESVGLMLGISSMYNQQKPEQDFIGQRQTQISGPKASVDYFGGSMLSTTGSTSRSRKDTNDIGALVGGQNIRFYGNQRKNNIGKKKNDLLGDGLGLNKKTADLFSSHKETSLFGSRKGNGNNSLKNLLKINKNQRYY
jgi:hypothetical protein